MAGGTAVAATRRADRGESGDRREGGRCGNGPSEAEGGRRGVAGGRRGGRQQAPRAARRGRSLDSGFRQGAAEELRTHRYVPDRAASPENLNHQPRSHVTPEAPEIFSRYFLEGFSERDDDPPTDPSLPTQSRRRCTVTTATNGKEAIDALLAPDTDFDLILTDIMMPEVDGMELMRGSCRERQAVQVDPGRRHVHRGRRRVPEQVSGGGCRITWSSPSRRRRLRVWVGTPARLPRWRRR